MYERIKQFAEQSGLIKYESDSKLKEVEKFAKLIVEECIDVINKTPNGYNDYRNQIEDAMRNACVDDIKQHFGVE